MLIRQGDVIDRVNFGHLLNRLGLVGEAVEVGTHRGEFAAQLLKHWQGKKLWCVDPWSYMPGYEAQAKELMDSDGNREHDMQAAVRVLQNFGNRAGLLQHKSHEICRKFPDASLDFVYIDGDHRTEEVYGDLYRWWYKVKPGGILAGHDFLHGTAFESVQLAVLEFCRGRNIDLHLVVETICLPWSYYLVKP